MEVLNYFSDKKLSEIFDFLGFVSIYEDKKRMNAYLNLLNKNKKLFKGASVVEAGAGFGKFSEKSAELGAQKVYSVEINKYMAEILKKKFKDSENVIVINKDIKNFKLPQNSHADILIHDFFGPLLYDESLFVLEQLSFKVKHVFPNEAKLKMAVIPVEKRIDSVVGKDVLEQLKGVLVSDLFENYTGRYLYEVCSWSAESGLKNHKISLKEIKGDLIVFCLEIYHNGKFVCSARECDNWPLVWTPRNGDEFELKFRKKGIYSDPYFKWIK